MEVKFSTGRATNRTRGSHILPNPDELRMVLNILCNEGMGAKVRVREGKNPDLQLRSQNLHYVELRRFSCIDSQDVCLEAAIHLKSA